jgi:pimeloyl-ACP methyl ester carboxylesterase
VSAVHTVATPALEIAYEEHNPQGRDTIVLLHGFPDDARTWDRVVAAPEFSGVRLLVPYLRGYGPTRFRSPETLRSGQSAALVRDAVEFLDALGIERCVLAGHDWGARASYGVAALYPERVSRIVAIAVGYGTNVPGQRMSYAQVERYWYQWFFATSRGAETLAADRAGFCRTLWERWSPGWRFDEAEYARTAASFENPDFIEIALHSYRHRWGFVAGDPQYAQLQEQFDAVRPIEVPVLVIAGADDGATLPEATEGNEALFRGAYRRVLVDGAGHFVQRERPELVIRELSRELAAAAVR